MESLLQQRRRTQHLRKNQTKEENHLWYDFLKKYPVQFRRQYPVGCYIVDFYCHKAKLVVELDGSQHCELTAMTYDQSRTAFLEQNGMKVLRFSNLDVIRRFSGVCEMIDMSVKERIRAK